MGDCLSSLLEEEKAGAESAVSGALIGCSDALVYGSSSKHTASSHSSVLGTKAIVNKERLGREVTDRFCWFPGSDFFSWSSI